MLLKKLSVIFLFLFSMLLCNYSFAQMRQIYVDNVQADNSIKKISFYTGSEGYVAFRDWIGYTTDSGRTFTKKYITQGNVNYNGYSVNLTFGFGITGVVAFNQNNIVVYGDYGLVPAILYSTNGGTNFTLVFHSQYNQLALNTGITDMVFPGSGSTGYAVDGDRILKSTNAGLTWLIVRTDPASEFTALEAVSSAVVFAMSSNISSPKLLKTTDGGSSWQLISLPYIIPNCHLTYAQFISTTNGWVGMYDGSKGYFYNTIDGGTSWTLVNNPDVVSLYWGKFKFTDNNTGYNLGGLFTTWKTFDGGITWEPLSRDNSFSYLGYSNNDLKFISNSQLWTGGGHGFLELSNNSGGATLPVSYFSVDTAAYATTGNVLLKNFSRTGYSYQIGRAHV